MDPSHWLPKYLWWVDAHNRLWFCLASTATWEDLAQARGTAQKDLQRAITRQWVHARVKHQARLAQLQTTMDLLTPLMQTQPECTVSEACAQLTPQALRRVVEL